MNKVFGMAAQSLNDAASKNRAALGMLEEQLYVLERILGEKSSVIKKDFDELVSLFLLEEKFISVLREAERLSSLAEMRVESIMKLSGAAGSVRLRYAELDYLKKYMQDIVFSERSVE